MCHDDEERLQAPFLTKRSILRQSCHLDAPYFNEILLQKLLFSFFLAGAFEAREDVLARTEND